MSVALLATILLAVAAPESVAAAPEDLSAYRDARAKVGRDAASQIKLALWCEAHGLDAERTEHLARAVLAEPMNAAARGLLGLVADGTRWAKPDDLAEKARADSELATALAEYSERRAKSPKTADGHWRMAIWCEDHGLEAEAKAHLVACVRLDPGRSAAWKRLGCKKVNGAWVTDEQVARRRAEADAQQKADKRYKPQFIAWRAALRDKDEAKRFEAERGLDSLKDPRAVASVWRVFVLGGGTPWDLMRAVQLLGQIDSPASSRALALIALEGSSPDLRRVAVESLGRRDPRDYLGPLINQFQDELRYEVRPVGGIGSPGALFVEGQLFNRMRVYAPPSPGFILVDTGPWNFEDNGFGVLHVAGTQRQATVNDGVVATFTGAEMRHGVKPGDARASALHQASGPNLAASTNSHLNGLFKPGWGSAGYFRDEDFKGEVSKDRTDTRATDTTIPIGRNIEEYRKAAAASAEQLRQDVAAVEAENAKIRARNARVAEVLNNATNQALPARGDVWRPWWADQRGYAYVEPPSRPKPTMVEDVPSPYVPQIRGGTTRIGGVVGSETHLVAGVSLTPEGIHHAQRDGLYADCFAAGTPVRTRQGARPIETLEVGDHVLAQDTRTGALTFKPVLAVFKFRPAETVDVSFGGEVLKTTPVHRFWKLGHGWAMARELRPGDVVRTLGGTAKVERIEPDGIQKVFNLEVADYADYFVGRGAILAGDNSLTGERVRPFDAPEPISAILGK